MTAPRAGIAVERRYADEGGEPAAVKLAEFRQLGDEGPGGHGSNSGHGSEQCLGLAPGGRGAHARVNVGVDIGQLIFEEGQVALDLLGQTLVSGLPAPIGLHADHLDDLPPAGDEFAEPARLIVGKRPWLGTAR